MHINHIELRNWKNFTRVEADLSLRDPGIGPEEVLRLEPSPDGTLLRWADEADRQAMRAGLTAADVLMPKTALID